LVEVFIDVKARYNRQDGQLLIDVIGV